MTHGALLASLSYRNTATSSLHLQSIEKGYGDVVYNGTIVIQEKKGLSLTVEKNIILEEQRGMIHKTNTNLVLDKKVDLIVDKKELTYGCL